jgi:cysteine sulfinate desulfinase/cysteine desulfurase-like protein
MMITGPSVVLPEVDRLGVNLLSIAGHKAYAPKGVGALYVRRNVSLEPLVHGAGHEGGRPSGTYRATAAPGANGRKGQPQRGRIFPVP